MVVSNIKNICGKSIDSPEAKDVIKRVLVSPNEGWEGYVMRVFDIEEGGYTPRHSHPWPHINYVLKGKGTLHLDGKDYEVEEGSFAYVPGNKTHQFSNQGSGKFSFICIVPEEGDK